MKINRRQFLGYTASAAAFASASWLGYRYLNPPVSVHINHVGLPLGHLLRDRQLINTPPQNRYTCQTLVLGSGAAGLSAIWYLAKQGQRDILLAEGFERNGNNAGYYTSQLGAPTGAHYLALPSQESQYVREMLTDLGILQTNGHYRETDLVHAPEERLWYQNQWQEHLIPQNDADTQRFFALIQQLKHAYGSDGKKLFAIPIALSSQDTTWRKLDTLTFAQWLAQENYRSQTLLWYLDYCCRDDYGQGIQHVSAFAGLHYFAARGHTHDTVLTWQDGLAHLSEGLRRHTHLQTLTHLPTTSHWQFQQPQSWNASALKIHETATGVEVILRHNISGETVLVEAQNVICAMPLMVAAHIVQNGAQYGLSRLEYAPWLVSNFVLHTFPKEADNSELAWDNVVYGSQGLGYVVASHQLIRVAKPEQTIFTAYSALHHDSPPAIRQWLLQATPSELLHYAAQDLLAVYGTAFWRYVSHVDISVRGHAMSVPKVGYLSNEKLLQLRQHDSRLLFAHSDLSSYSVFEEAVYWGVEAAKKVLNHS